MALQCTDPSTNVSTMKTVSVTLQQRSPYVDGALTLRLSAGIGTTE